MTRSFSFATATSRASPRAVPRARRSDVDRARLRQAEVTAHRIHATGGPRRPYQPAQPVPCDGRRDATSLGLSPAPARRPDRHRLWPIARADTGEVRARWPGLIETWHRAPDGRRSRVGGDVAGCPRSRRSRRCAMWSQASERHGRAGSRTTALTASSCCTRWAAPVTLLRLGQHPCAINEIDFG